MTTGDNDSLEELFTCKICFNNYDTQSRKPMLLQCQHSFCSICLPQLVKYPSGNRSNQPFIQCPFCNKQFHTPVSDVPKNRIILQLLEVSHGNVNNIHPPSIVASAPPPPPPSPNVYNSFSNQRPPSSYSSYNPNLNTTHNYSQSNPQYPQSTPPYPTNYQSIHPPYPTQQNHAYRPVPPPRPAPPPPPPPKIPASNQWSESEYLRKLFRDVDINGDGTITFNELHSALARGQINLQFDIKTAEMLVNKYDTNHDGEINFHEFEHLFNYLNEEYFKFLLADTDGSSTIDSDELDEFFRQRGHKFNKDFCNFIINTIKSKAFGGVTFDYYCRLMARFDFLIQQHANYDYYKAMPLEKYLKGAFFSDFW